jgi:hypothetical protein
MFPNAVDKRARIAILHCCNVVPLIGLQCHTVIANKRVCSPTVRYP